MVTPCPVPAQALLQRYVGRGASYVDCYAAVIAKDVDLADFVVAFYTTGLFRLERLLLSLALRRRIGDAEVTGLAHGGADSFAIWRVEARDAREMLLSDLTGGTRSWLAVEAAGPGATRLMFGSAVAARGDAPLGPVFRLLLPFHKIYSRGLLAMALRRLARVP